MSNLKVYEEDINMPQKGSREIHLWIEQSSKFYNNQKGKFPVWSRSGNQYIMVMYHFESNTILNQAF